MDRKEPQEGEEGEPVDRRTALHLDLNPLTIDPVSMEPEAIPLNAAWRDETDPECTRIRTVMDSGAAQNVGPPTMAPLVRTRDSPVSLRGQAYLAAGHERIPYLGQQTLNVVTN